MVTTSAPHRKLDPTDMGLFYGMRSGAPNQVLNPYALTWRLPNVTADFTRAYTQHNARICVRHRPFGESWDSGPMDLDQAVTIKNDEKWSWLIDQYHEETEKLTTACPDAIVLDYIGTVENQLEERRTSGRYSELLHRLWASVQPLMNHKVWIGFDATCGSSYPDGSVYHHFVEMVTACKREQGQDTLVEALPATENIPGGVARSPEWTQDRHALCLERFYQGRVNRFPTGFRYTSDTATTFRVANGHSRAAWDLMRANGVDPLNNYLASCIANGHNPVMAMPGIDYADAAQQWQALWTA